MHYTHRLLWPLIAVVTVFTLVAPPASADEAVVDFVEAYVEEHLPGVAPGVVFGLVDGSATVAAWGLADPAGNRPLTTQTPLRLGSISKPVTAATILELAEEDEVDLDVGIDRYLALPEDGFGPPPTLRQLLQHRGGYPDAIVGSHHLDPGTVPDPATWVEGTTRTHSSDVVGSYSSVGYTLAGHAVAAAQGVPWADVAEERLFEGLGMGSSTFGPVPADVAVGHVLEDGVFEALPVDSPALVAGAGLVASGEDVVRFLEALVKPGSGLSEGTRAGLLTRSAPEEGLRGYSIGLTERTHGDRVVLYHEANGIGTTSRIVVAPDLGIALFTSANAAALEGLGDPSAATTFIRDLQAAVLDRFYPGSGAPEASAYSGGAGRPTSALGGWYGATRVDEGSFLRLEALIGQSRVTEVDGGVVFGGAEYESVGEGRYVDGSYQVQFLAGPVGETFATVGGTGSYERLAWWETLPVQGGVVVAAAVLLLVGIVLAVRRRGESWLLAVGTAVTGLGFVGTLAVGAMGLEVMEVFTSVPVSIRVAQGLVWAAAIGVAALVVRTIGKPQGLAPWVVFAGGSLLVGWATYWGVLLA